jgi:3-dehydroquinate synthase
VDQLVRTTNTIEYPVIFTRGVFDVDNAALVEAIVRREPARRHRVFFVVDDGLAARAPDLVGSIARYVERWAGRLEVVDTPMLVPGGETAKNQPRILADVLAALERARIDRHSFVVAVGGGAVLDMVGYAAAITHRGVRLVRVPSTVLSQADSAVGVKNGVNAFGKKNYFGTFVAPFAVIADTALLETLPERERIAGTAEAIKVALLRDPGFFAWLVRFAPRIARGERDALDELVRRSAALHLEHIARSGDPFECGSARPLDFGHWAAHKVESLTAHRVRHGEGVAIGIAIDMLYARSVGICSDVTTDLVLGALRALGLPLWDRSLAEVDAEGRPRVLGGLDDFREHLGGDLSVTLLRAPGSPVEVNQMDHARVAAAVARLESEAACAS